MPDETAWTIPVLCLSAFAAGVMNAVAGGGTLLTFPALLAVVSPVIANATSTIALLPGSLASTWGYRAELRQARGVARKLLPPSLAGGTVGALLLVLFPDQFGDLVPWLVLTAAVLFLIQPVVSKRLKARPAGPPAAAGFVLGFQFAVAVYGGYFGAGIGILMLAALGFLGMDDIHRMNAVKTLLAAAINFVSVIIFVADGIVNWRYAGVMAVAAMAGGYAGSRVSRRVPARYVRWAVVAIGFGLAGYYFARRAF